MAPIGAARTARIGLLERVPNSGISRWTFDDADTSGSTAEDIWGTNDGTINGATTGVSGANQTYTTNEAYSFDGTDDYVALGDVYDTHSNTFSVAGWAKVDSYDGNQVLLSTADSGGQWEQILRVQSDGNLYFLHNDGGSSVSVAAPTAGTWFFYFAYYDVGAGEIGLSIDAGTRSTLSASPTGNTAVDTWDAGRKADTGNEYWFGDVDDTRAFDKVLSTTEESNLYNTGSING